MLASASTSNYHSAMFKITTTKAAILPRIKYLAMYLVLVTLTCSGCTLLSSISRNLMGSKNAWSYLQNGFRLTANDQQPEVKKQLLWLEKHPRYLQIRLKNAKNYIYFITKQTRTRNLPTEIALMPIIESGFDPLLVSRAGASGLWQLMPGTASGFGLKINWWYDGRRDITKSTKTALNYLVYLHQFFNSWPLAIAAYDSGEGTVLKALHYNLRRQRATNIWALRLPEETRTYYARLLAIQIIISDPQQFGVTLPKVSMQPTFTKVTIKKQTSLPALARLSNCNLKTLEYFNPAYRRGIINAHNSALIPTECMADYDANISYNTAKWVHHKVVSGDTLSGLAVRYHSSVSTIIKSNKLKSTALHIGQTLMIPSGFKNQSTLMLPKIIKTGKFAEDDNPGPRQITYITKHGDSLWSIAKKFNLKTSHIRYWNKLPRHLKPNTAITIWLPPKKVYSRTYTIKSGDTLSAIALRHKTTLKKLKYLNKMQTNTIHAGEKIKVPVA